MAAMIGKKRRVQSVIDAAVAQGCQLRVSETLLVTAEGDVAIRFLHNPNTGGRFDLTDYNDDEYMVESEWTNAERRLEITLPSLGPVN